MNWSRVEELRSEIGEDDFAEVVELFMSEADSAIARLNGELPDKNLEGTLHFLKGCMLNLGFDEVATVCAAAEDKARDGESEEINLPEIRQIYHSSRAEFLKGCSLP